MCVCVGKKGSVGGATKLIRVGDGSHNSLHNANSCIKATVCKRCKALVLASGKNLRERPSIAQEAGGVHPSAVRQGGDGGTLCFFTMIFESHHPCQS